MKCAIAVILLMLTQVSYAGTFNISWTQFDSDGVLDDRGDLIIVTVQDFKPLDGFVLDFNQQIAISLDIIPNNWIIQTNTDSVFFEFANYNAQNAQKFSFYVDLPPVQPIGVDEFYSDSDVIQTIIPIKLPVFAGINPQWILEPQNNFMNNIQNNATSIVPIPEPTSLLSIFPVMATLILLDRS